MSGPGRPEGSARTAFKASIVMLAVPFSAVGAVWLMYALGYNVSIAAWVGMIALMGLDAETGVFMLLFLDLSYAEAKKKGQLKRELRLAGQPSEIFEQRYSTGTSVIVRNTEMSRPPMATIAEGVSVPVPPPNSTAVITPGVRAPLIDGCPALGPPSVSR